ncbi:TrmB family transcriptional regulator [Halobaculum litoreum]|uniref:TrmB family transcriptional regulator n=1 Tax=Halobaculum litoreum TaxID=3031998 RepID=A0ABD5XS15_9EURY
MPTDQTPDADLRSELRTFGLSDTEIDTYVALLERGEATTGTVSEEANVSRRAVYDVAERLADRGLVRVNDHASPTTIRPRPPRRPSTPSPTDSRRSRPAERRHNRTEPRTSEVQVVKSRPTALKRLDRAIGRAESELLAAVPSHVVPEIESEIAAAAEDGTFVLLLVGGVDDEEASSYAGTADAVRCWDEQLPFLYAADNRTSMIGDPELLSGTHSDAKAVTVTDESLSGSVHGLFLSGYWPAATEVSVAAPDPLPSTYEWFREATFHAAAHHAAGRDVHAVVDTADGTRLAGRMTDVNQSLIEPATNDFSLETSIVVETGEGTASIGGIGSFVEDYRAESVRLETAE